MSAIPFSRSIGDRSGVRMGYIQDATERFTTGDAMQTIAGVGRFNRGRIDKAIVVPAGQLIRMLGKPQSPTINALNEAQVQISEAFSNGAQRAVVSRLAPAGAMIKWMVAKATATTEPAVPVWSVTETDAAPSSDYVLAVKHMECFNDGVRAEIHAPAVSEGGNLVAAKTVTIRLLDTDGNELYSFTGSLDPEATDEYGNSTYLPNVVSERTDDVEVVVASGASIPTSSTYYGLDSSGKNKVAAADLNYFSEGGTSYSATDIARAVAALRNASTPYRYVCTLGSKAVALVSQLAAMVVEINKHLIVDVPGDLTVDAAVAFVGQLNIDTHHVNFYWAPHRAIDPMNGGKAIVGTSGVQAGLRCRRNSQTDANGVPPMNYPVAGRNFPLSRQGVVELVTVSDDDLEKLAKARINPVIYQTYNAGAFLVFYDSLTAAKTSGDRKLISVAEMSSQVDDWIAAQAKEYLQLPMSEAVTRMTDYVRTLFAGVQAANWLTPSEYLEGRAYVAQVQPSTDRPKDKMRVTHFVSYDGATRVIETQQTIVK